MSGPSGNNEGMALDPSDPLTRTTADPQAAPATTDRGREAEQRRRGGLLAKENRRLLAGLILGAAVAIFAVLNRDDVDVNWIVGSGRTPLILVIAISFVAGVLFGYLTRAARDRRKRP